MHGCEIILSIQTFTAAKQGSSVISFPLFKESRFMGDPCVLWFTAFLRYTSSGGGDAAATWGEEQDHREEDPAGPPDHPGKEQAQLRANWTSWSHGY